MNKKKDTQHIGQDEILRGEKVSIRPPRFEELSFIRTLWADPETVAPVGGPHHLSGKKARAWFAYMVDPGGSTNCYCLIFNQENIPIGEISFHRWNKHERSAGLNIKILATHRGCGYGKDALQIFLAWFFGEAGGRTMSDNLALDNKKGQRLLRSIGFEQDVSISNACMLIMTKQMYTSKYGEPNKSMEWDRAY